MGIAEHTSFGFAWLDDVTPQMAASRRISRKVDALPVNGQGLRLLGIRAISAMAYYISAATVMAEYRQPILIPFRFSHLSARFIYLVISMGAYGSFHAPSGYI